ncbi:hypothetical protein KSP39_PZI008258 [Platanthera zijinensis]|uniref:Uncharacterized protein n=1 Tax=Platanthera zijinensis TaxID=2320716 RepID=A0AAP0BQN9_9ASPA
MGMAPIISWSKMILHGAGCVFFKELMFVRCEAFQPEVRYLLEHAAEKSDPCRDDNRTTRYGPLGASPVDELTILWDVRFKYPSTIAFLISFMSILGSGDFRDLGYWGFGDRLGLGMTRLRMEELGSIMSEGGMARTGEEDAGIGGYSCMGAGTDD